MINAKRIGLVKHITCGRKLRNGYKVSVISIEQKYHLDDLDENSRNIIEMGLT
jgi:hypothetical protein